MCILLGKEKISRQVFFILRKQMLREASDEDWEDDWVAGSFDLKRSIFRSFELRRHRRLRWEKFANYVQLSQIIVT